METKARLQKSNYLRGWIIVGFVLLTIAALTPVVTRWGRLTAQSAQAREEIAELRAGLIRYYRTFGEPPGGDRSKVPYSALTGLNSKGIIFFTAPYSRFSPEGELVDPWRRPYQIDLGDPYNPRIYSCGPDKRDDQGADGSDDIVSWR